MSYGVVCNWDEAIHHEGSGQMHFLKDLMQSVDYINGKANDSLLISGQKEKHDRVAVFAGDTFLIAYDYLGNDFTLDTNHYTGRDMWWMSPVTGVKSYIGKCNSDTFIAKKFAKVEGDDTDRVLIIK